MALPTTEMSGYTDLRARISLALGRCQEQPWLDFKESQPWLVLQWRLLKTIMGMANLRDGGLILIGVCERAATWTLTGIEDAHLATFDYDDIVDKLSKYASPQVQVNVVIHDEDKKRYLAIHVYQSQESPVICRNSSPVSVVNPKERIEAGNIYVRPTLGKPQTVRVTDAGQLHDLLELAAEFRARKMLQIGSRVGLVPAETAISNYNSELQSAPPVPISLEGYPYWQVRCLPESYTPELLPSLTECFRLIQKTRVQWSGWDFPHLSNLENEVIKGSKCVGSFINWEGIIQYWYLFQSGQFFHRSALREATTPGFRDHLGRQVSSRWRNTRGFVSLENLVYTITDIFELAARICQSGTYRGLLQVSVELFGVKDYQLTPNSFWLWRQSCTANDNILSNTWELSSEKLIGNALDHSLTAVTWFCERFGWLSPDIDALRKMQEKLLTGKL